MVRLLLDRGATIDAKTKVLINYLRKCFVIVKQFNFLKCLFAAFAIFIG